MKNEYYRQFLYTFCIQNPPLLQKENILHIFYSFWQVEHFPVLNPKKYVMKNLFEKSNFSIQ